MVFVGFEGVKSFVESYLGFDYEIGALCWALSTHTLSNSIRKRLQETISVYVSRFFLFILIVINLVEHGFGFGL